MDETTATTETETPCGSCDCDCAEDSCCSESETTPVSMEDFQAWLLLTARLHNAGMVEIDRRKGKGVMVRVTLDSMFPQ